MVNGKTRERVRSGDSGPGSPAASRNAEVTNRNPVEDWEQDILDRTCRGCDVTMERLLKHLNGEKSRACRDKYTDEEIEKHKIAIVKRKKQKYSSISKNQKLTEEIELFKKQTEEMAEDCQIQDIQEKNEEQSEKKMLPAVSSSSSMASPTASQSDTTLIMECEEEELSEAQEQYYKKKQGEYKSVMARLEEMARLGAKVSHNADNSATLRVTETHSSVGPLQPGQLPGTGTQHYRLLMDRQTGRILGSLPQSPGPGPSLPTPPTIRANTPTRGRGRGRGGGNQPLRPAPPPTARSTTPVKTSTPQVVDLTKPGVEPVGAPQPIRKAFPALSVTAKPQRDVLPSAAKRSELDAKVKSLLVHTPAKFTEWLIQQGLVRSEQYENGVKLKLGMYSDGKKFPHSGGYVWIQEGSATKYTSVFRGSIFETTASPPTVLLKLIYHWSCQTNIPNVAQWVKVENSQIDSFFANCRSVCVSAVQEEVVGLGGLQKVVEVGVISLGTTTADGQKREVRVEVLGVLDRSTRRLRLRATEPIQGASQGERFGRIFEPLPVWVHRASRIVTDYSVDRETLLKLGYKTVVQCSLSQATGQRPENTNQQIMDYLKKVVPKMFQNTLSNLTTPVIQQFLDELTFRELFGKFPLACFEGLIQRIATQTATTAHRDDTMVARLARVAANPFLDWRLSVDKSRSSPGRVGGGAVMGKRAAEAEVGDSIDEVITKKIKLAKELVGLESYYYASLPGEASVLSSEFKADMAFKCHVCKKLFMNNLEFMKHLHLHVETDRETAIDMADLSQCRYCYKDFDSETKVQEHLDSQHLKTGLKHVCRICDESFGLSTHLIHHMQKSHVRAEMPYLCQICSFRSSQHRDVIEHFQNSHDRTDKLQCPLCLKTTGLYGEKGYSADTAVRFLQHLQRHEDTKAKAGLNCRKCALKFVDEKSVKSHYELDHGSYKDWEDTEPTFMENGVQMPPPDERGMKTASRKSTLAKPLTQQAAFASQNLEDLAIYDASGDQCCECNKSMTLAGHYVAYLCCTKCRYSSCCAKAMTLHVAIFHSTPKPVYNLAKPVMLEKEMFCCCGFSTQSGNKLAKHLGTNRCKSAYPSREEADRARVDVEELDPRMSITESHRSGEKEKERKERKEEGEEKAGPLSFLGLRRHGSNDDEEEEEKDEKRKQEEEEAFLKQSKTKGRNKLIAKEIKEKVKEDEDETMAEEDGDKASVDDNDTSEGNKAAGDEEEEEDDDSPKPGEGMLLFGTLFKYMGEKKDKVEGNGKESVTKDEPDQPSSESKDEGKQEDGPITEKKETTSEKDNTKTEENIEKNEEKDDNTVNETDKKLVEENFKDNEKQVVETSEDKMETEEEAKEEKTEEKIPTEEPETEKMETE